LKSINEWSLFYHSQPLLKVARTGPELARFFVLGSFVFVPYRGMKTYKTVNGTSFDARTSDKVIRVLELARQKRTRLHISLGDSETGEDWLEEFDISGYVGRSMGPIKVPLLIANRRSLGGGAILDHCIVRIRLSAGGQVLYQHDKYHHGSFELRIKAEPVVTADGRVLTVDIFRDSNIHASFTDMESARRWIRKVGVTAPMAA
jgi:hypothetical protein